MIRHSFVVFASLTSAAAAVACTSTATGPGSETDPTVVTPGATPEDSPDAGGGEKPDAAPTPKADAGPTKPSAPLLEMTIGGKTVKVKNVKISPTGTQYPDGVFRYYVIDATLEESPEIVPGQMGEPSIAIRVGQAENGADACKEERGPRVGFVEPVTELREIQIKYKRFNGSSTIIAAPTTNSSGACMMTIHADASKGEAWGEATGSVRSGTTEPALPFTVKWFQPVKW